MFILKSRKGLALALLLALLPCLMAALLSGYALIGFIQTDLALKYFCRQSGISGQKKVSPLLQKLIWLNPEAISLKTKLSMAQQAQAAAIETGNFAALPAIRAKILYLELKRRELDSQQKQLIRKSNNHLSIAHRKANSDLLRQGKKIENLLLSVRTRVNFNAAPKLAVRPDYPDMAPTYSPLLNFEDQQALTHKWQYEITVQKPFSRLLPEKFIFFKACLVTLRKENSQWLPQITKGKLSLKSVW